MNDIYDDPEFRNFVREVKTDLIPKLESSAVVASILPLGETDVKFALELGLSIMLDKPIVAIVRPGVPIPEKLARVVDAWVESRPDREGTAEAINAAMQDVMPKPNPFKKEG
jgi:hypothetical protein